MLPGGLPIDMVQTFDWRRRLVVHPSLLRDGALSSSIGAANVFFIAQRSHPTPYNLDILPAYGVDTWAYRSSGEVSYVEILSCVAR